jgi:hypothetical protein
MADAERSAKDDAEAVRLLLESDAWNDRALAATHPALTTRRRLDQ